MKKGREAFRLLALLSPEAWATLAATRVEARGQVDQAEKQLASLHPRSATHASEWRLGNFGRRQCGGQAKGDRLAQVSMTG